MTIALQFSKTRAATFGPAAVGGLPHFPESTWPSATIEQGRVRVFWDSAQSNSYYLQVSSATNIEEGPISRAGYFSALYGSDDITQAPSFPNIVLETAATSPVDRRQRTTVAASRLRAKQRSKNEAAIALLESWISKASDVDSEARSLAETISALNEARSSFRRLYP